MINNTHICRDCVIQEYGCNLFVYRNGRVVHEVGNIPDIKMVEEISKIVTMIREGVI